MKARMVVMLIATLLLACTEEYVADRPYPRISSTKVTSVSRTSASFSATIYHNSVSITDHGFVVALGNFPTFTNGARISLGSKTGTGLFTGNLTGLTPNSPYVLRSYTISQGHVVFSQDVEFKTPF